MINRLSKSECCGCEACVQICPKHCISLTLDGEGFYYPLIDTIDCIECELCEKVCPSLHTLVLQTELTSYAAINQSDKIRFNSSSGGVFYELARYIIEQKNGVVYGAGWVAYNKVQHMRITKVEDILKLQKSKYVQSLIGDSFRQVKSDLKSQRFVLFSGTPCQIKALRLFLQGNDYDHLFMVDIACHGIPSLLIWNIYLDSLHVDKNKLSIDFRDKNAPWHNYTLNIADKATGKKVVFERCDQNPFMRGFICNLYNRLSCHNCPAKNFTSGSDVMLADYWGIEKYDSTFDDNKGTSLIITKNTKGEFFFHQVKQLFSYRQTDFSTVTNRKDTFCTCTNPHYRRELFFRKVNEQNFESLVNKYLKHSHPMNVRIARFIKRIIGRK